MQLDISRNFVFLESSKEIREMVQITYSKAKDASFIYEIKTRTGSTKQGNLQSHNTLVLMANLRHEKDLYKK